MEHNLTDSQVAKFNALYERANRRMKDLIYLDGYKVKPLGFIGSWRIRRAISDFRECLVYVPNHWPTLFFLGKAYQRLGNYPQALEKFEAAMRLDQTNHNIPREASLVAVHLNDMERAIRYGEIANSMKPNDATLLGNHAMNLLLANRDKEAQDTIEHALKIALEDQVNKNVWRVIDGVIRGQRARPNPKDLIG